jgi:hypothetical protein
LRTIKAGEERFQSNQRLQGYAHQYNAVLPCVKMLGGLREHGAAGIALIAYGWMPTIPRDIDDHQLQNVVQEVVALPKVKTKDAIVAADRFLSDCDAEAFLNRSWIGTSKFLHFLRSDLFPIWDTNICLALGGPKTHSSINQQARYCEYFNLAHRLSAEDQIAEVLNKFGELSQEWSPIRKFEFLLFASNFNSYADA